jgi:hypothetical protein
MTAMETPGLHASAGTNVLKAGRRERDWQTGIVLARDPSALRRLGRADRLEQ